MSGFKSSGYKRVRYFEGKMLTVDDLATEQNYHREKQKLHNRALHGAGIVSGLEISVKGTSLSVNPGLALDPFGNEILVPGSVRQNLPSGKKTVYVCLAYSERETDPVPSGHRTPQYSRTEEGFTLLIETAPGQDCIPIARLAKTGNRWRTDKKFKPPRTR